MGEALSAFLERHVETFNAAVESGDFAPLVALFADDATLEFAGVPVGPFHGRDAIAAAYVAQPPSDTMTVLGSRVEEDGTVVEPFSWSADGGARSGEMRLVVGDGRIRRLVVVFDPDG
jgi:ketosteroid isomerase-like protein